MSNQPSILAFQDSNLRLLAVMDQILSSIEEQLAKRATASLAQQNATLNDVTSFISAVDWSETWIQILVGTHVLLLILIILTRKDTTLQFVLLFTLVVSGGASERINGFLRDNWIYFSRVNYFDEHGTFISFMYSLPIVVLSLVILINILITLFKMLIMVKRQQVRQQLKNEKKTQ